ELATAGEATLSTDRSMHSPATWGRVAIHSRPISSSVGAIPGDATTCRGRPPAQPEAFAATIRTVTAIRTTATATAPTVRGVRPARAPPLVTRSSGPWLRWRPDTPSSQIYAFCGTLTEQAGRDCRR